MPNGHVKWFNNAKGYGFIIGENASEDYFAHYSSIQIEGYKTLKAGQAVSFDIVPGDKGAHAINIKQLNIEAPSITTPSITTSNTDSTAIEEAET